MILVRSPLRITLGGGGTDLPAYYTKHGGTFITAAIDKYVYVSVLRPFMPGIYVKAGHNVNSRYRTIDQIPHPLIREALRMVAPAEWEPQIEITTLADVPAGTGLGSSSACACALLRAFLEFFRVKGALDPHQAKEDLAEAACRLEMDILGEPIGKQDAYASAFGGMPVFSITEQGVVTEQARIDYRVQKALEARLQLYFTGFSRNASDILRPVAAGGHDDNLGVIAVLGDQMSQALRDGSLWNVGPVLTRQWVRKLERSPNASNDGIDRLYNLGVTGGANGGKLVGAGGGGFLLFSTTEPEQLRATMAGYADELPFQFEPDGTMVICQ